MKNVRRKIWPVFVVLVLLLSMSLPETLLAEEPARSAEAPKPEDEFEGFTFEFDVAEDGSVTAREVSIGAFSLELPTDEEKPIIVEFGGLKLKNVGTKALGTVMEKLGLEVEIPEIALEPEQVKAFVEHDVQHLAVHKVSHGEFQEVGAFVNNVKTLEAKMSDETLDLILEESGLEEAAAALLAPALMMKEATFIVRFPGAEEEVSFADKIEPKYGAALNRIEVGATVSGTNGAPAEIVSAGGFTIAETNELLEGMGSLPIGNKLAVVNLLTLLESEKVVATAGRNGAKIESDNGHWVEVAWDQESREAIYDLIPVVAQLAEFEVPEGVTDVLTLVEDVLPNTEAKLVVHNAEKTKEDMPSIHLGQTLGLELRDDAHLFLGEVDLGPTLLMTETFKTIGTAAIRFDGSARQLRSVIGTEGGEQMPIVFLGEGAFSNIGRTLTEDVTSTASSLVNLLRMEEAPEDLTSTITSTARLLEIVDDLVGRIYIGELALTTEGEEREADLDYTAAVTPTEKAIVPTILLGRKGGMAFTFGEPEKGAIGVTRYMGAQAAPITGTIASVVNFIPKGVESVGLTIDSNAVMVRLNGAPGPLAGIDWDPELRGNLLEVVDKATGAKDTINELSFGIVAEVFPDWDVTLTEILVGAGKLQWGVEVAFVESVEEIPPTALEELLLRLGVLPPLPEPTPPPTGGR